MMQRRRKERSVTWEPDPRTEAVPQISGKQIGNVDYQSRQTWL